MAKMHTIEDELVFPEETAPESDIKPDIKPDNKPDKKAAPKKFSKQWIKAHWQPITAVVAVLVLIGVAGATWYFSHPASGKAAAVLPHKAKATPTPKPLTKASPLTGVQVAPD